MRGPKQAAEAGFDIRLLISCGNNHGDVRHEVDLIISYEIEGSGGQGRSPADGGGVSRLFPVELGPATAHRREAHAGLQSARRQGRQRASGRLPGQDSGTELLGDVVSALYRRVAFPRSVPARL